MQHAVVEAAFGRVPGAMRPAMASIQLLGVPFAGWVFDTTGSYKPSFATFLVLYLLSAAIVYLLRVKGP